jgi:Protein of unknown function (DUF559)
VGCGKSQPERATDAHIARLADRQHGVVARWQLIELGLSRRAIEWRLANRRLHRVYQGVYAVVLRSISPRGHRMAAVLAYGRRAVLSHRQAGSEWGICQFNQRRSQVTVPKTGRANRPHIRVHHADLHPEDVTVHNGIPVTSVARTLLDIAPDTASGNLLRMVEEADRRAIFDLGAVERVIARNLHHKGAKRLSAVITDYREPPPVRSEFEREFLELIEREGIPRPLINTEVCGAEVDICWPDAKLIVELDGRGYHSSPHAFETDRLRDARLLKAGYVVLRITYRRLRADPQGVIDDIFALLRRPRA